MLVIESARKHGISDRDIEYVFETASKKLVLHDEPYKAMVFGYDTIGRALEVGFVVNDTGESIIIHAMKLRGFYRKYLS
ncbi:MAG: hypothetical protein LBJ48_05075 [Coriobacteriales bacterium]|jgi:hypothetical protein|nr:hypothetical protein [Coriobacteriales bacterium]